MHIKIANAFTEAAQAVLLAEVGLHVTRGEMALLDQPFATDEVAILISLVGSVNGTVLYSLSEAVALNLVGRLMGEPAEKFTSLAQSGIAELGNVITGQASVKLSQAGHTVKISPPTLLMGKGTVLSTLDLPLLFVPLNSEAGGIGLHLALREVEINRA